MRSINSAFIDLTQPLDCKEAQIRALPEQGWSRKL